MGERQGHSVFAGRLGGECWFWHLLRPRVQPSLLGWVRRELQAFTFILSELANDVRRLAWARVAGPLRRAHGVRASLLDASRALVCFPVGCSGACSNHTGADCGLSWTV